ncbi:hypothetical protein BsWGS_08575 [Bradybaena similaris]
MMSYLVAVVAFLYCSLQICCGAQFLLAVPKEAYYDVDLVVSVSAFGLPPGQRETVSLEFRGQKDTSKLLNSTSLLFTSDGSQVYQVQFTWERIQQLEETGVDIVMSCGQHESRKTLPFTQNFGYIFIQTDKPVYTPLETVRFRVIAVDEYQKLAKYMTRIDIKNDKGIVVDRFTQTAEEAFKAKEFPLPRDTLPGEWSISASFEGIGHTLGGIHKVVFEVKEYVLPRFSSVISLDQDVITNGTEWIIINVTSRYVYGRPVFGSVKLELGVWKPAGVSMLPVNFTEPLEKGLFTKAIKIGDLLPKNLEYTRDTRLYVKAIVTESASQESYVYEDTSTFITDPYYEVDFKPSKKHFKPGFPYTFQARVAARSGRRASWVQLHVVPLFYNRNNQKIGGTGRFYTLDELGEMKQDFDIPKDTYKIIFTAVVVDMKVPEYVLNTFEVTLFPSANNEYIHISVTSLVKENQDGRLLLQYTPPKQPNKPDASITVLVVAKGHIIFSNMTGRNQDGRSNVILPSHLYTEMSPHMRIVAYYYVQSHTSEFVVDSLLVDTPDVCLEEIYLNRPGSGALYKPKDKYALEVEGGPGMNVGFVAVDKAVFLISNKPTLNRNMMFSQLGSHDKGDEGGDGSTVQEVFRNSGLHHMTIDLNMAPNVTGSGARKVNTPPTVYSEPSIGFSSVYPTNEAVPPQTVRNIFPESWFFEERKLPNDGFMEVSLTLPDPITTWSFLAVGISSTRGICVSRPLEQPVSKLFFTDVRLPYKVTRLEEVKVKIAVYNYNKYAAQVTVTVTGSDGLCFPDNTVRGQTQNSTSFTLSIPAQQAKGEVIKMIPLRNGDLTLRADVQSQNERDIVEKQLHVVAEGLRVRKSLKFVLDPEAKHATYRPSKENKTVLQDTSTISNVFDLKNKKQQATIDLALPSNVIRGTETCRISAFGDLMGDIITHAVVESRNLINTPQLDAEGVLGDLAPTIHALLSARSHGLLDENLMERGRKFVRHGVTRLLKYRNDDDSFSVYTGSKPCTWLTAFALKTLCHATSLAFIDRQQLIYNGFDWLLMQVKSDGSLREQVKRVDKLFAEYNMLLSAEVLIAIKECQNPAEGTHLNLKESHLSRQALLSSYLESKLNQIKDPLVLSKVTYALMLSAPNSEKFMDAYRRLTTNKRKNTQAHAYWSKVEETNEAKNIPFWNCKKAHASAIEATAYALLVFLRQGGTNTDAIADWLVGQRNYNGAFISAMDSTAAIQALSQYSFEKHDQGLNLHCNISSSQLQEYFYLFKFTEKNALLRESLNNVPVGQVIDVNIKGQGLGQMQVNVEYNIPVDKNENCQFKVTVDVRKTEVRWSDDTDSSPLCSSCNIGCPKLVNETKPTPAAVLGDVPPGKQAAAKMRVKVRKPKKGNKKKNNTNKKAKPKVRTLDSKPKSGGRKSGHKTGQNQASRQARSAQYDQVTSKKSICVHVCFLHQTPGSSSPIEARIEMLSGYYPVMEDIEMMKKDPNVRQVNFEDQVLKIQFSQISCKEKTCVAFRAVDEEEVGRLTPANVELYEIGSAAPQCVLEYNGTLDSESLRVYCADFAHENRGECRCYSGLCSSCKPMRSDNLDLYSIKKLACDKQVAYQLQIANITNMANWVEINSRVISLNKTGSDNIMPGSIIKLMSPSSCACPVKHYQNNRSAKFYMLSRDVEKLVDRNGDYVYNYLLDEQSVFLNVSEPGMPGAAGQSVPYFYLQQAFSSNNRCQN